MSPMIARAILIVLVIYIFRYKEILKSTSLVYRSQALSRLSKLANNFFFISLRH